MDIFGRGGDTGDDVPDEKLLEDRSDEREKIEDLVSDLRSQPPGEQKDTVEDLSLRLDGRMEERTTAARTLLEAARTHPDAVERLSQRIFDRLTEREFARPIAELLLLSAERLRWQGVGPDAVVDGATRGLERSLGLVHRFETAEGLLLGGGATEVGLATELRQYGAEQGPTDELVLDATAAALEGVPQAYAWSAGVDQIDALEELRSASEAGDPVGVDRHRGELRAADHADLLEERDGLEARLVDGIALAGIAILVDGTVSQLDAITGKSPYPV